MDCYEYEYPETIWAVSLDTVALDRVICSPLDHGTECPRYIRADIVTKLLDEACAIIKKGQDAASASYQQAHAEWHLHDKTQDKCDAIVQDFRNAARRFISVHESA